VSELAKLFSHSTRPTQLQRGRLSAVGHSIFPVQREKQAENAHQRQTKPARGEGLGNGVAWGMLEKCPTCWTTELAAPKTMLHGMNNRADQAFSFFRSFCTGKN